MDQALKTTVQKTHFWTLFLCGVCMGAADLVPGISGGTIAFILGVYTPLLASLKTLNFQHFALLLKGQWTLFSQKVAWRFLVPILLGMATALISLANGIHFVLEHEIYRVYLYATFLGLIVGSFIFCLKQVKKWSKQIILGLILGALGAYSLTGATLTPISGSYAVEIPLKHEKVDLKNYTPQNNLLTGLSIHTIGTLMAQGYLHDSSPIYNNHHLLVGLAGDLIVPTANSFFNTWLIFCGALAICALLLPGISGSYILTLLGVYPIVIESLVEFINGIFKLTFPLERFATLASLGMGIIAGAFAFARSVSWLLKKFPDQTLAVLSGFMIGAIQTVWPFWNYEYAFIPLKLYKGPQLVLTQPYLPSIDSPLVWHSLVCGLIGMSVVFILEKIAQKKMPPVLNMHE